MAKKAFYIKVSGRVQGVGYRYHCQRAAQSLGLQGWVRNLPDGDVDMEVEGDGRALDEYIKEITREDAYYRVIDFETKEIEQGKNSNGFTIRLY